MTKLTKNQRATIVRLFASGTSTANLAEAYGVSIERIEQVIREAMIVHGGQGVRQGATSHDIP